MKFLKNSKKISILFILLVGAFLRFYGLNWGLPYLFHPDERNMAVAITRFSSKNLNPEFYAYGQFPLYLAYFSSQIIRFFFPAKIKEILSLVQATVFLRFWSAFFSTATIYVVYLIAKKIFSFKNLFPIYYLLFTISFTPGLIQAAHFGTTESVLAFCFLAIVYLSFHISEKPDLKDYFGAAFFLGIALSSKISAAVFVTPLILATLLQLKKLKLIKEKLLLVFKILLTLFLSLVLTFSTSPYLLLAYKESRGILLYEIAVAKGQSLPFYTRQFSQTTPILFQLQKIFPYALGWQIFIFGILGFVLILLISFKKTIFRFKLQFTDYCFLITVFSFLLYFILNAFLFAKWTRFMAPIFSFFSIFAAFFLNKIVFLFKSKKLFTFYFLLFTFITMFPGLLFSSIYFRPDIRFTASQWIYQNIPSGSQVLFDTANVIDIPIPPPKSSPIPPDYFLNTTSFDFYHLDENPKIFEKLKEELEKSDYIFVPSRRVFMNHMRFPEKYPLTTRYYQLLFSGRLGFKEAKTFYPYPKLPITNYQLQISDEQSEETFTVFDHPVIRIYKKIIYYNKADYEKLFKI